MKPLEYFKFWLKSSNEHGIHSPFVFNWITQGLYAKNPVWDTNPRSAGFVQRVFGYFKPQKVAWLSAKAVPDDISSVSIFFPSVETMRESTTSVQMIYVDESSVLTAAQLVESVLILGNDAFVLVDKRRLTPALDKLWRQLVQSSKTTVTMDFYYYGLAFVRKEQLKQHFSIRT
ncbi:hypothetical protein [Flavobacterium sp. JP2137]|uniref:hypothetical protein n=1 Tax=Flavobacterium sp. JP2137 TaxID=3414510 RepID=UPI003D2FC0FE